MDFLMEGFDHERWSRGAVPFIFSRRVCVCPWIVWSEVGQQLVAGQKSVLSPVKERKSSSVSSFGHQRGWDVFLTLTNRITLAWPLCLGEIKTQFTHGGGGPLGGADHHLRNKDLDNHYHSMYLCEHPGSFGSYTGSFTTTLSFCGSCDRKERKNRQMNQCYE